MYTAVAVFGQTCLLTYPRRSSSTQKASLQPKHRQTLAPGLSRPDSTTLTLFHRLQKQHQRRHLQRQPFCYCCCCCRQKTRTSSSSAAYAPRSRQASSALVENSAGRTPHATAKPAAGAAHHARVALKSALLLRALIVSLVRPVMVEQYNEPAGEILL